MTDVEGTDEASSERQPAHPNLVRKLRGFVVAGAGVGLLFGLLTGASQSPVVATGVPLVLALLGGTLSCRARLGRRRLAGGGGLGRLRLLGNPGDFGLGHGSLLDHLRLLSLYLG